MKSYKIIEDDVLNQLEVLAWDSPFHAILSDPPYGLSFMNKKWDSMTAPQFQAWVTEWATLMLKVVYPGAVLMMFGGTRTYHRLACGLEDAGWEIYDSLAWMYGSGFPKSHDISKALDREAGAEREVIGRKYQGNGNGSIGGVYGDYKADHDGVPVTAPATPDAERWQGYGTALKPAYEPIVLARAPRTDTYAKQALTYGTWALNIDGCRIAGETLTFQHTDKTSRSAGIKGNPSAARDGEVWVNATGRWPANVLLDEEAAAVLDEQSGESGTGKYKPRSNNRTVTQFSPENGWNSHSMNPNKANAPDDYGDKGGASRFFYTAKASTWERSAGLDGKNTHPTVKPIKLTTYLATLLLPPELDEPRRLLVPFSGSGSEMIGGHLAGWDEIVGIEIDSEYKNIAEARLAWWSQFKSYEEAQAARKK